MIEITEKIQGNYPGLYVYIPSSIRNEYEIIVGDKFHCTLLEIYDQQNRLLRCLEQEGVWEIQGYWNELHIPDEVIKKYELKSGYRIKIRLSLTER